MPSTQRGEHLRGAGYITGNAHGDRRISLVWQTVVAPTHRQASCLQRTNKRAPHVLGGSSTCSSVLGGDYRRPAGDDEQLITVMCVEPYTSAGLTRTRTLLMST